MARRKNKRRGNAGEVRGGESDDRDPLERRARAARAALDAGRHKDAIAACKALLKECPDGPWREALAAAYAGRAGELAAKGMFVEALAIHEQRATACDTPRVTARYVTWMLLAGRTDTALALLGEHREALDRTGELAPLRERLAALALADDGELAERLAANDPDDPLVRDHAAASELLDAFCTADEPRFDGALKRIPFRSPYRGFRQLLAAWRQQRTDPEAATAALERIDPASPFHPLAGTLRHAGTLVREVAEGSPMRLLEADARAVELAAIEAGWPAGLPGLLADAKALGAAPDAKARLELVLAHADTLGEADARAAAATLLIAHPKGRRAATKRLGEPSAAERARLAALLAEREGDPFEAEDAWERMIEALVPPGQDEAHGKDARLRAALVHRRLADHLSHGPVGWADPERVRDHLAASLELDPEDIPSAVRLIASARDAGDLKGARAALSDALERFPGDVPVLLEAVRTALASDAFKKAAGFAKRLLEHDPVNVPVQGLLLEAHLAHARKQFRAGKVELARRQLDEAGSWTRGPLAAGRVDIVRGLVELADGEREAGAARVRRGFEALGGALAGRFAVNLESERLARHAATVAKLARLPAATGFREPRHVLELIRALGEAAQEDARTIDNALAPLDKTLRAAAKGAFAPEEDELVCETLLRVDRMALLEVFAAQAMKRWPERPVFVYHLVFAETDGSGYPMNHRQERALDHALERAHRNGDMRLVHRIEQMVGPSLFGFPGESSFPDDVDDPPWPPLPQPSPRGSPRGSPGPSPAAAQPNMPPEVVDALIELLGPGVLEDVAAAEVRGEGPEEFFERIRAKLPADGSDPSTNTRGGKRGGRRR